MSSTGTRRGNDDTGNTSPNKRSPGGKRYVGYDKKWWRISAKNEEGEQYWKSLTKREKGSVTDTILHRYLREVGAFASTGADAEDRSKNAWVDNSVRDFSNEGSQDIKNRVEAQSCFERVILTKGRDTAYYAFLMRMRNCFTEEGLVKTAANTGNPNYKHPTIQFVTPEVSLIKSFIYHLRTEQKNKWRSIDCHLSGISSINGEFAGVRIAREALQNVIKVWKDEDDSENRTRQATVFSIVDDLPYMYQACFQVRGWGLYLATYMWCCVLVMGAVLGRASCMSQFCPNIEDITFPSSAGGYDIDGIPKCIYIGFRNWKWRKRGIGTLYYVLVPRNYTDPTFCPVLWILRYLSLRRKMGKPMTGKLFDMTTSEQLKGKLDTLYKRAAKLATEDSREERAEVLNACSSHSIRRTFAQHAARCGASAKTIKDVGRWKDTNIVSFYVGQGNNMRKEKMRFVENVEDFKDDVGYIWVWKSHVRSEGGEGHYYRL